MNPKKIILNAEEYEWAAAEVVSVDYENLDPARLYTIQCKFLNSDSSTSPSDLIQARALNANIKQIPIKGEVVLVCKGPTPYHSGAGYGREYYYTHPISIQSSVHHNGLPGANKVFLDLRSNSQKSSDVSLGLFNKISERTDLKEEIEASFPERNDVFPVQPFPGDLIIEGRWGQSIRFGSTVDTRRKFQISPTWGPGTGATGNPITIISNGTNPIKGEKPFNSFHIESTDDDSSIWLTSGQSVRFTPSSNYSPSIFDKQIGLFRKNIFGGNSIIMSSDRIVLNSNKQEIVGFAKEGIGFATEKTLALNAKNIVEIEGGRISLGFNATSPMILGDRLIEVLKSLMDILIDMNQSIIVMKHVCGVGDTTPPLNSGDYVSYVNALSRLMNSLPKIASKFAFVNEFAGGPSQADKNNFSELQKNNYIVKLPERQGGDKSGTVTFNE